MKELEVPITEELPEFHPDSSDWKTDFCNYLMTFLRNKNRGAIIAKWDRTLQEAKWIFSESSDCFFESPGSGRPLFIQKDISWFRSVLASLGLTLAGNAFIGAGTFRLTFENNPYDERLHAVFISNSREFGYWIKLQIASERR